MAHRRAAGLWLSLTETLSRAVNAFPDEKERMGQILIDAFRDGVIATRGRFPNARHPLNLTGYLEDSRRPLVPTAAQRNRLASIDDGHQYSRGYPQSERRAPQRYRRTGRIVPQVDRFARYRAFLYSERRPFLAERARTAPPRIGAHHEVDNHIAGRRSRGLHDDAEPDRG